MVGTPCVAGKCQIRVGAGWGLASHQLTPYTTPIVLAHNLNTPYDIDVDADNVYWTDTGDGSVWQVGVNGGTPTPLATGLTSPTFMALGDNYVYWMDSTSISRVRKGGGGVQSVVKSQSVLGLSVSGEVVTYIDELTFNRIDGAGGTPTPLGGAVIPSGASPARLAGTLFSTGFFVWTPTGKAAVTGAPVLGRGAWLDDQGGSMYLIVRESLGPTANTREGFGTLYAVPSTLVDISGPYYFSAAGIAWYVDAGPQRLLAVTSKPRHLYATADAVYWTDDRSVLKALTCTE